MRTTVVHPDGRVVVEQHESVDTKVEQFVQRARIDQKRYVVRKEKKHTNQLYRIGERIAIDACLDAIEFPKGAVYMLLTLTTKTGVHTEPDSPRRDVAALFGTTPMGHTP